MAIWQVIFDLMKFESGFTKREFVVTSEDMYPQDIKFELLKEKCGLLDSYNVGDGVKVSFNIRGSLWQGKYFTNLQVLYYSGNHEGCALMFVTCRHGVSRDSLPPLPTLEACQNGACFRHQH